jgi:hypothetical protein
MALKRKLSAANAAVPTPPAKKKALVAGGRALRSLEGRPRPTLVLELMMFAGVLDAVDLCAVARCSRAMRDTVDSGFAEYVPVSRTGKCVLCGALTRFRHPVEGSMLCAPCGTRAERKPSFDAAFDSPSSRFAMAEESHAKRRYGISLMVDLGNYLPYAKRPAWMLEPHDPTRLSYSKYAPAFAPTAKRALQEHEQRTAARPSAQLCASTLPLQRVFLQRDVVCLLHEKYGGPRTLNERVRHRGLPALDLSKPDE